MSNAYEVTRHYMHFVIDEMRMYDTFANSWNTLGNIEERDYRLYQKQAFETLANDIDDIINKHYGYVRIVDIITCDGFVWSVNRAIGKRLDAILVYGFDYVMHSYKLKAQYVSYVKAYEYLNSLCVSYDVFNGNMH